MFVLCCVFFISLSKLSKHAEPEPFFVSQSDPHVLTFLPPIVICTVAYWWGGLHTEDHWSCSNFYKKKVVMLLPFLVCTYIYVWMKQGVLMKTCQTSTKQSTQQQRGRKRVQDGWTQVHIKRRNHQLGRITRGTWTNQGLKLLLSQGACHSRRGEIL